MAAAVDVALEGASFRGELTYGAEAEDLEAAAIGENGTVPALKAVQAACLTQYVQTGAKVEMIGIAEDNLGMHVILEVLVIDALHRADGSDRHEDRSADIAVIRMHHATACG